MSNNNKRLLDVSSTSLCATWVSLWVSCYLLDGVLALIH